MNGDFFHQLFDYNFYCNKSLIEDCLGNTSISDRVKKLFCHILNAHHIWNHRILKEKARFDVWQEHHIEDWTDIHQENQRTSFEIITNAQDFDERLHYTNSAGKSFSNTLQDMLFHIINHSTHHRGQIMMDFRINQIKNKPLDYIFYKR